MPWIQLFDEEIADFDAISPAWDKHATGLDADWDAEVDADNDLNESVAAAHDGAKGYEITFDDANVAYGRLDMGAIDQVTACVAFWFDPHSFTPENDKRLHICRGDSGAPQGQFYVNLRKHNGTYQMRTFLRTDGGLSYFNVDEDIPGVNDDWHFVVIFWGASTGAGNDDGYFHFFIDNTYWASKSVTGVDNDEKDVDSVYFGMIATTATTFGGSFYMDECYIDPVGAPMVNTLAAKNGTYGLMIPVLDSTTRYGLFTGPAAETIVTIEYWINPSVMTIGTAWQFWIPMLAQNAALGWIIDCLLSDDAGGYRFRARAHNDLAGVNQTGYFSLLSDWNLIRLVWAASTGPGNDDGYLLMYINTNLKDIVSGIDNDTKVVDRILVGAPSNIHSSIYGILTMDDIRWADEAFLLPNQPTMIRTQGIPTGPGSRDRARRLL